MPLTDLITGVKTIVAGVGIGVDSTDPENPIVTNLGGVSGQVNTVVGGTNISVDASDPVNPIVNLDGTDLLYLRLDTANGPLTGALTTQQLDADTNQTRDLGTTGATGRFAQIRGRVGNFLGYSNGSGAVVAPAGIINFGTNPTGLVGGNVIQTGAGIATFEHGGGAFKAVGTLGNVFTSGPGNASFINNGGGSFLGGSAYVSNTGNALLTTTSFGNFTWGYSYASGAGNHTFRNAAAGGFLGGYSQGAATITVENFSSGPGCFTWVRPTGNAGIVNVFNRGDGGFLQGRLIGIAGTTLMEITTAGDGGFCQGIVQSTAIMRVSGLGAFAQGSANGAGANILASGNGSFAHGQAGGGNAITASGAGSFAVGDSTIAAITANATNAVQLGPGVNSLADSLQVGTAGLRLKGTSGAPGALQNGDIWRAGAYVYIRSNGVSVQI